MNPFLSIWGRPTETIRYVLNHKTLSYSFLLLALASLAMAPISAAQFLFIEEIPVAAVVFFAVFGLFAASLAGWLLYTALYTWVGKWLGGTGTFTRMLSVVPLGSLPLIWIMPFSLLLGLSLTVLRFTESGFAASYAVAALFLGPLLMLIIMGLSVYGTVILSKGIGIVHGFSAWKGFGTIAIILGIFIALYIVFMIVVFSLIFSLSM
ncbi:YIP1 family protein [Sporosarcina sp. NCCP-2716]|uniref:YIP1 family protein n=1 Tax=Sporosarcina sp. NCCP-2716 TaxID=2943679 RepID=UPI002041ACC1|nr:YIP1 family protein [Sporosarcina sp. NCCP-2716]